MKLRLLATAFAAALIVFAGYAALFIAPEELSQIAVSPVQRIFYFHLSAWIVTFTAFFISFVANIAYLSKRAHRWDALGVAGVEVGVMACTIGLVTGPLWGKPVWGIWWTWDARLTTTFIMWLLYISYLLLRGLIEEPARRATLSAVFGIFAFLDVPLVYASNRLWRTQHPQPVIFGGEGSGLDATIAKVLLLCVISLLVVMIPVLIDRYRLELLRHDLGELRFRADTRVADTEAASSAKVQR